MFKKTLVSLSVLAAFSGAAFAAQGNAVFQGNVANTCILTAGDIGAVAANSDFTNLSSSNAGGQKSTISALATGNGFKVSTVAPTAFTTGDSTDVTFATNYDLTGSTTGSVIDGSTETTLSRGRTTVAVGLDATKSSGSPFEAGDYTASVTVRCE